MLGQRGRGLPTRADGVSYPEAWVTPIDIRRPENRTSDPDRNPDREAPGDGQGTQRILVGPVSSLVPVLEVEQIQVP